MTSRQVQNVQYSDWSSTPAKTFPRQQFFHEKNQTQIQSNIIHSVNANQSFSKNQIKKKYVKEIIKYIFILHFSKESQTMVVINIFFCSWHSVRRLSWVYHIGCNITFVVSQRINIRSYE